MTMTSALLRIQLSARSASKATGVPLGIHECCCIFNFSPQVIGDLFIGEYNGWAFNALTNRGSAEVESRLLHPVPCAGQFSDGIINIYGKPI